MHEITSCSKRAVLDHPVSRTQILVVQCPRGSLRGWIVLRGCITRPLHVELGAEGETVGARVRGRWERSGAPGSAATASMRERSVAASITRQVRYIQPAWRASYVHGIAKIGARRQAEFAWDFVSGGTLTVCSLLKSTKIMFPSFVLPGVA